MPKKSLLESNPYLKDLSKYRDSLITNVSSSTAIETMTSTTFVAESLKDFPYLHESSPSQFMHKECRLPGSSLAHAGQINVDK